MQAVHVCVRVSPTQEMKSEPGSENGSNFPEDFQTLERPGQTQGFE